MMREVDNRKEHGRNPISKGRVVVLVLAVHKNYLDRTGRVVAAVAALQQTWPTSG